MSSPSSHGTLQPPLRPRDGRLIRVLGIARISTEHQDQRSLADQEALYRHWLGNHVELPYQMEMIASRGSGECLDREESLRAWAAIESDRFDLVITEDLGRISPFRLCDGGLPVLRARFTLHLTPLLPDPAARTLLAGALERSLQVDLFEPPQREAYRLRVRELTAARVPQRHIAKQLAIHLPTVQRAVALDRMLAQRGSEDPYVPQTSPPEDHGRMCRHLHPRYRFEPLPCVATAQSHGLI